jgi:peptidoglycan/LPS O-acetylase OafA/YrhL
MQNNTRNNNFNLLRFIFAVLVLLSHAPELADGNRKREILTSFFHTISFGELAVDGFFLLSGFLIVQSWSSRPVVFDFLSSRVLRIFPGFIVASVICAFIVGPLAANPINYFANLSVTNFVAGMLLLQEPVIPAVFSGTPYPHVNGAMWTISFEFICYLGVLMAGVSGLLKRPLVFLCLTISVVTFCLLQRMGYLSADFYPHIFLQKLVHFVSFFMVGSCFYLFRHLIIFRKRSLIAGVAILVVGLCSWRFCEVALLCAGGYLLFFVALTPMASLNGFNRLPDVSYGIYLYGWPVQKLFLWYSPLISPWLLFVLSFFSSLLLGVLSWYVIEKPFLKFKRKMIQPAKLRTSDLSAEVGGVK